MRASLLLTVLGTMISATLSLGCSHTCVVQCNDVRPPAKANPHALQGAKQLLDDAELRNHAWGIREEREFAVHLSRLPVKESYKLALRLVNLINHNKIKLDRGESVEPQCPCATCMAPKGMTGTLPAAGATTTPPVRDVQLIRPAATPVAPRPAAIPGKP